MAPDRSTAGTETSSDRGLVWALATAIVVVALMLAATAVFGFDVSGAPPFDITPDPAGSMPF